MCIRDRYCPHKKLTGKFSKCSDEAVPVMIIEGHVLSLIHISFFLSFPHYRVKIESNKGSVFGTHIKEEMD